MKYTLHPGAQTDLREAADFYKLRAGASLARSLLEEFDHAVNALLQHPALGTPWRHNTRKVTVHPAATSPESDTRTTRTYFCKP